ncbi:MAG: SpoIIE family protein phosphatase [Elusimicrobiota bacterium]|jgi:hypothetical protein|nr:SpoIIE family protein phosphatase [Elusimicrobiota bacterium]
MQYIQTTGFLHNKDGYDTCGDHIIIRRGRETTFIIVMDGIGSGPRANICAQMFGGELTALLKKGYSLLESCRLTVQSIKAGRAHGNFAAFSAAAVLHSGYAQIISYEAPIPIFINDGYAYAPQPLVHEAGGENLMETDCTLGPGRALVMFSDGVSEAGVGHGFGYGLGTQGAADKLNDIYGRGGAGARAAEDLLEYCKQISGGRWEDDTSLVFVETRPAINADILTGPPAEKDMDSRFIEDFRKDRGFKIICGSTTLDIYARHSGAKIQPVKNFNPFEAPTYKVPDIDFASEGALMLNQLYNLYELNPVALDRSSPVARLKELLDNCDKINFYAGRADNPAQNESMIFSQLRILPRAKIVEMLAAKLRKLGKAVAIKQY